MALVIEPKSFWFDTYSNLPIQVIGNFHGQVECSDAVVSRTERRAEGDFAPKAGARRIFPLVIQKGTHWIGKNFEVQVLKDTDTRNLISFSFQNGDVMGYGSCALDQFLKEHEPVVKPDELWTTTNRVVRVDSVARAHKWQFWRVVYFNWLHNGNDQCFAIYKFITLFRPPSYGKTIWERLNSV